MFCYILVILNVLFSLILLNSIDWHIVRENLLWKLKITRFISFVSRKFFRQSSRIVRLEVINTIAHKPPPHSILNCSKLLSTALRTLSLDIIPSNYTAILPFKPERIQAYTLLLGSGTTGKAVLPP